MYKLVGDNIDKNVRPREMNSNYQTRSFHSYSVSDCVDMSQFSNTKPITDLRELLPMQIDEDTLCENFAVLVGRTLAKYIPFYNTNLISSTHCHPLTCVIIYNICTCT